MTKANETTKSNNSLSGAVKTATKSNKKAGGSLKNPQYYNAEKTACIDDGCNAKEVQVRAFFASNSHTPQGSLKAMIKTEKDQSVLSLLLVNESLPIKSIIEWANQSDLTADSKVGQIALKRIKAAE